MNMQNQVFKCSSCDEIINSQSSQRGLPRSKCNNCKKERDRLVNLISYWETKVGIKIQ